jgi:hypothetical protein
MGFLWRIDPRSDWRSRSGRLLGILIDGLKARARPAAFDLSGSHDTLAG